MSSLVLIVDDEYVGRETLQSVLEGEGYRLEMAENGRCNPAGCNDARHDRL